MSLIPPQDFTVVAMLAPLTSTTAGPTKCTPVDVSAYEGVALVVVNYHNTAGTNPTLDIALQAGAASNGSDSAAIYNTQGALAAVTQATTVDGIQVIAINLSEIGKYLTAAVTIGGTNTPGYAHSVVLLAQKKYA
jgi:hypothetical protein